MVRVSRRVGWWGWSALGMSGWLALMLMAGCGENPADKPLDFTALDRPTNPSGDGSGSSTPTAATGLTSEGRERAAVLVSVIRLIESASTNPGGSHFTMAAESLNDYFSGSRASDFEVSAELQRFLKAEKVTEDPTAILRIPRFSGQLDGRHLEDCLLLRDATRTVLKSLGPDTAPLARAERLFDWVVRQVQLVPPGLLAPPNVRLPDGRPFQAQARPYDVLLRGLATEDGGIVWAERSWLFLAMCQQAGLDAGLMVVEPPATAGEASESAPEGPSDVPAKLLGCGVLIDGQVYLFDAAQGLAVPGPGGRGVATVAQVVADPTILAAMEIPGEEFAVTHDELTRGRLSVLLEATSVSMAQRMRLLQDQLTGDQRMVVYADPSQRAARFQAALGDRLAVVKLWPLPLEVEARLFQDNLFNQASGYGVQLFNARWPLLKARLAQLRGDLDAAVQGYVGFRFADAPTETDGKTPIGPELGEALDAHATQFLALAQLDRGQKEQARFLFRETMRLLPAPGPGRPYFAAFRWGAQGNLGRLLAEAGEGALASRYLSLGEPTPQSLGNRLMARELIWRDPFLPPAELETPPPPASIAPANLGPVPISIPARSGLGGRDSG